MKKGKNWDQLLFIIQIYYDNFILTIFISYIIRSYKTIQARSLSYLANESSFRDNYLFYIARATFLSCKTRIAEEVMEIIHFRETQHNHVTIT